MKKLKVALVSPYPPGKGTLNEYAYHFVSKLSRKAEIEQITLISEKLPEGQEYPEFKEVPVKVKQVWSFNSYFNLFTILKAILKSKADIVFFNIHFLSFGDKKVAAALGLMIPFFCRIMGLKSVVLLHNIIEMVDLNAAGIAKNPLLKTMFNWIGSLLTRFILSADLVAVTISKYADILESKYGAKNVALIPHGSFETPPIPDFETKSGKKKIMTFGKFGTYKKVEGLIEAVEMVRAQTGEELEIVIAGTDSPNKVGYLAEVQKKYSHVSDIQFTGYVLEEDVPRIFQESHIVIFPYTSTTGSSGVLHQAGTYGKACILPNIGDLKLLIEEEGYQGAYFQPGNTKSLAESISYLLENDDERKKIAQANYQAACSLPMNDIADWYLCHFDYLLDGNNYNKTSRNTASAKSLTKQLKKGIQPKLLHKRA